jgi:hypothetical protein
MSTPYRARQPDNDEAVQSIGVATALIERFNAIASSGSSVNSASDDLELRIGESQQIYPEIWRHLEDARRVLVANGREVGDIDALRASELQSLGVTDVEITRELEVTPILLGIRVRYTATKAAAFNLGGIARAEAVTRALMRALPEVDWTARARAQAREIAAAGSMQTRKWLGIVKLAVAIAAVIGVATVLFQLVMSVPAAPPAAPEAPPIDLVATANHAFAARRQSRIVDLRAAYAMTCDPEQVPELVKLLRDDGQPSTADRLEHTPCTRRLPSCEQVQEAVRARLIARYKLVVVRGPDFSCHGIVVSSTAGPGPAFAVLITGTDADHQRHTYRGVVAVDDTHDLVAFQPAPVPVYVGAGDLDGDHRDEVVTVGGARLVVSRIVGDHFVDLDGPALPTSCQANVNIERDLRDDGKTVREALVISVDDSTPRPKCPEPGRHFFSLVHDELVED